MNLGSRLEAATKSYGAKILVGEDTYEQVKDRLVFREVDRVKVKGKNQPVKAYELLAKDMNPELKAWLNDHQKHSSLLPCFS